MWVLSQLKRVLFPSSVKIYPCQAFNAVKNALAEGRVLYRYYFSHFPVTPLPSRVPRSCPVPVAIWGSDGH